MLLILLSYLAGALTILSPCILPVLPFVFARAGQPFVAGPCAGQGFLVQQHAQGLVHAIDMLNRRRSAPILPQFLCLDPRRPVPIGRGQIGPPPRPQPFGDPDKGQAGRGHQPLLAGRDQQIDAPVVHMHRLAAQRGNSIHAEECRVIAHGPPQRRDIGAGRAGGIDLTDQNGGDPAFGVLRQPLGQTLRIGGGGAEIQLFDRNAKRAGGPRPGAPEMPRGQHQGMIAPVQQVGIGGLPPGMAIADIDREMGRGAGQPLESGDHGVVFHGDRLAIDVGRGAMHGAQHPVWRGRGAGNGDDGMTLGETHAETLCVAAPSVGCARTKVNVSVGQGSSRDRGIS